MSIYYSVGGSKRLKDDVQFVDVKSLNWACRCMANVPDFISYSVISRSWFDSHNSALLPYYVVR